MNNTITLKDFPANREGASLSDTGKTYSVLKRAFSGMADIILQWLPKIQDKKKVSAFDIKNLVVGTGVIADKIRDYEAQQGKLEEFKSKKELLEKYLTVMKDLKTLKTQGNNVVDIRHIMRSNTKEPIKYNENENQPIELNQVDISSGQVDNIPSDEGGGSMQTTPPLLLVDTSLPILKKESADEELRKILKEMV